MKYDKLIRDKIPEIISASGKVATVETMSEIECRAALLTKLVEEAREVQEAMPEEITTELADVLEVVDSIARAFGIEADEIQKVQAQRRAERGGFEKRLRLLEVK